MADDVSIVIAAQDQASQVLKSIGKNTEQLARTMEKAAETSSKTQRVFDFAVKGFIGLQAATMAAKGAFAAFSGAMASMEASVAAFSVQEEAARGMTQAQLDYAASLQVATNVGDETTLALLRQAEAMGATKDESDELVTTAIGLAEAFGISQAEALKKVMQATNGNANALQELIPEIRNAATEEEKLALITQAAGGGLEKLQADADTTKGAMERSAGAFGDLSEKIGALLAPIYKVVHTGLAVFAETLQQIIEPAIDSVSSKSDFFAQITEVLATTIIKALTMAEVAWNNFGTIVDFVVNSIALYIEGMIEDFKHTFTVVIPAYAEWFGKNFFNIIRDYFTLIITALKNSLSNIGQIFQKVWEWIKSGMTGGVSGLVSELANIDFSGITEGFEAQTEALPEIAERATTATEKALGQMLQGNAMELANAYESALQPRLDALKDSMTEVVAPELESKIQPEVDVKLGDDVSDQIDKISTNIQQNSAMTGRLITRGRDEGVQQRIMQQTVELRKALMEVKAATEKVESAISEKPVAEGASVEVLGGSA